MAIRWWGRRSSPHRSRVGTEEQRKSPRRALHFPASRARFKTWQHAADTRAMSPARNERAPGSVAAGPALLSALLLGACAPAADPDSIPAAPAPGPCEALRGARFQSRALFPAGLGPDGPEPGHQVLGFSADGRSYEWTREDMSASGACTCDAGRIEAAGSELTRGMPVIGVLDPVTGILTWDGIEFELVP